MSVRASEPSASGEPTARRMSMRADASGGGGGGSSRGSHAANEPSISMQPPALDASPFDLVAATEPLEYARVLEIYNRRVEALNQYQEALMVRARSHLQCRRHWCTSRHSPHPDDWFFSHAPPPPAQRYTALAQPGQAPPLPAHFRYYLGSCLRAAGDDMTALEFFTQQIAIYQVHD
jgi:hypothetical protein